MKKLMVSLGVLLVASFAVPAVVSATANSDSNGANVSGPYDPNGVGNPSGNGNSGDNNGNRPDAGTVGNADDKNPPGQQPGGNDHNKGYECDENNGVGKTNPAHSGCTTTTTRGGSTTTIPVTTTLASGPTTTVVSTVTTRPGETPTTLPSGSATVPTVGPPIDIVGTGPQNTVPTLTEAGATRTPAGAGEVALAHTGPNDWTPLATVLAFLLFIIGGVALKVGNNE